MKYLSLLLFIASITFLLMYLYKSEPQFVCYYKESGVWRTSVVVDGTITILGDSYCYVENPEDVFYDFHKLVMELHGDGKIVSFNK